LCGLTASDYFDYKSLKGKPHVFFSIGISMKVAYCLLNTTKIKQKAIDGPYVSLG
jgi:hypothetical protein